MQGCNFAHVLGLYRMSDEAGQAFYLRSRGALADMLLWAIFRLQTRVLRLQHLHQVRPHRPPAKH